MLTITKCVYTIPENYDFAVTRKYKKQSRFSPDTYMSIPHPDEDSKDSYENSSSDSSSEDDMDDVKITTNKIQDATNEKSTPAADQELQKSGEHDQATTHTRNNLIAATDDASYHVDMAPTTATLDGPAWYALSPLFTLHPVITV